MNDRRIRPRHRSAASLHSGANTSTRMTDMDTPSTDDELLAAQATLQAEAAAVLADLRLFEHIMLIGTPVQTGSSALGLMVARDIDVTTLCPSLEAESVFDVGRALTANPRVHRLSFRNYTGRWNADPDYPDGLYWMVEYVTDDGTSWNLDLWFLLDGTTQFDLEHVRTLPPRLTREARLAILRIKHAWHDRPPTERVPSYRIYEAVLDHAVRTADDFGRHLERQKD
jgi:hypothetical protein